MSVKLIVAVTDKSWFEMLRRRPDLEEVNFWAPSPQGFHALRPGELFLFKLHSPDDYIVGGGVFQHAVDLPCSHAWEFFREANGANSAKEMRDRIVRYRRGRGADQGDFEIGCRILTQPFFFEKDGWIPVPPSWSPNIVRFKTYSTAEAEGRELWEAVVERAQGRIPLLPEDRRQPAVPSIIEPRLGLGGFRMLIRDVYGGRCAVTEERTIPALGAAHIRPRRHGGMHEARNGLLLRRDIGGLFDAGYVTVTPELRFEVSPRIREEFHNGRQYYELHGREIIKPAQVEAQPDPQALRWHNENCYRD